jgi:3-mercaptopyruvate sulfurtransferase SseA
VALTLYDLEFRDVQVLQGGWNAWQKAGYPITTQ